MQKLILTFSLSLISLVSFGQKGYVEFDTILYSGVKIIEQNARQKALVCKWQKGKEQIIELTPFQLKSYAVGNKKYNAKDVTINGVDERLFLEVLSSGNITIYFVKKDGNHYFIENDNVLFELFKHGSMGNKSYKETLQSLSDDCEHSQEYLKYTLYNKHYLKRFTRRYNACEEIHSQIRFGIMGGLDYTSYSMLRKALIVSETPSESIFSFGAFLDIPLFQSKFSFHPEIMYSKYAYSLKNTVENQYTQESIANIELYSFPLLLRYTLWQNKWNPFINIGVVYNHYSRLESSVIHAMESGDFYFQKFEPVLSPAKYALTGGVGVWYKLTKRNSLFVETRTSFNSDKFTCNVVAGFNF